MVLPPPRATIGLVAVTTVAWLIVAMSGWSEIASVAGGFIPARVASGLVLVGAVPTWATPLTSALLHAGVLHIGFNMMMLAFCGRYVELAVGPVRLLILYVIGAYAAAAAQWAVDPASTVPMIGASGAASAVLGAYALLFGGRKRASAHPGLDRVLQILWLAAAWIGVQVLMGLALSTQGPSIAVAAHIGGFIAGLILARPLVRER